MSVEKLSFGALSAGESVEKYVITNKSGAKVSVITYGATIAELFVPDRNGKTEDVLRSFDDLEGFVERCNYQGMTVAPYANRIANAKFTLNGTEYSLIPNEKGVTNLHSAGELSRRVWSAEIVDDHTVRMTIARKDGIGGFPGDMTFSVSFTLTDENELKIEYKAETNADTYINPTNHAYFNLAGQDSDTNADHLIRIEADCFTPVDAFSIPTGELKSVDSTPFDLRAFTRIGDHIDDDCEQLALTGGYDHNFCIRGFDGTLRLCATVKEPGSGRMMEVLTDLPGVQFYAGNFLAGALGKGNKPLNKRCSFCLETQFYPDTPNHPNFPSCLVKKGETFRSTTVYRFTTF